MVEYLGTPMDSSMNGYAYVSQMGFTLGDRSFTGP